MKPSSQNMKFLGAVEKANYPQKASKFAISTWPPSCWVRRAVSSHWAPTMEPKVEVQEFLMTAQSFNHFPLCSHCILVISKEASPVLSFNNYFVKKLIKFLSLLRNTALIVFQLNSLDFWCCPDINIFITQKPQLSSQCSKNLSSVMIGKIFLNKGFILRNTWCREQQ